MGAWNPLVTISVVIVRNQVNLELIDYTGDWEKNVDCVVNDCVYNIAANG